jgi:hypothetical protein
MNRVTTAIEKTKLRLQQRLESGETTPERAVELHRNLDMEPGEYCRFQELKSHAQLEGTLTLDEAQTIYSLLGNTPENFNAQPVEVKSVLTMIFGELLERRIR